ncbi:hypothetical protein [Sulfurimonas sp.]|jgi:response regulator RpfG family c-di-GMP phosphodiesterase|uniref:hypothetical protein n=1 Tax=Sulfurimonas sp. TaxID=2022749 RepID=UPI0025EC61B7|nr:hypothetical protein [Sulfurimonas sp.]MBT5933769.1 hypothetical protein [Sulfurimonas sp.]
MNTDKKWNILFIEDENTEFDLNIKTFDELFNKVDRALDREDSLKLFNSNEYDIVIGDLSKVPENIAFMKQLQDIKPSQSIFVFVDESDEDKVYGFADMNINAFIISADQFEAALEELAKFDPYAEVVD